MPVRRPRVVIISTLALPLDSRPSETRYSQTPIRLPMRSILRLRDVTGHLRWVQSPPEPAVSTVGNREKADDRTSFLPAPLVQRVSLDEPG
jgi:hypothetical protein